MQLATGLLALVLVGAACGKSSGAKEPVTGGVVGFDQTAAAARNGPYPKANPTYSCGSDTSEFAAELAKVSATQAKVQREWGDVIKDRLYSVAGSIQNVTLFNGDLPFTHPFGNDMTFDITPDPPFADLAQVVGPGEPEGGAGGTLHWEIERGLVPHQGPGPDDFLEGFMPQDGDRIATYGRWIVDCGHNDYHTEIHPPVFVTFGHQDGQSTVAHGWYTPYRYTQLLNPDPIVSSQVANELRFEDTNTKTFPRYLVAELLRVGHLGPEGPLCCHDSIQTHQLVAANTDSPVDWYVCAPGPKPGGAHLSVSYSITIRPGVSVSVTPNEAIGCAAFHLEIGPSYHALDPLRKTCLLSWDSLNKAAQDAIGDPTIDVKALIEAQVPASFIPAVELDPSVDCYDTFQVPVAGEAGKDQSIATVSTNQPFPFYGTMKVSWSG